MRKRIDWTPRARLDVRGIDRATALNLLESLADYAINGYGDVERLQDISPPEFRLRVGDYRIRFREDAGEILVLRVLHRSAAYR
jgi:mRNA-degrading endonuclease RelE of RelBE toxin-antitoxin system